MAIDITGLNSAQPGGNRSRVNESQNNQSQATNNGSAAATPAAPASVDTVKLSDTARTLQSAEHDIQSQPEIDNDRVAALRAAIDDGSYQVDSEKVAGKMLQMDSLFD